MPLIIRIGSFRVALDAYARHQNASVPDGSMSFLRRGIDHLLELVASGKLVLGSECDAASARELQRELSAVQRDSENRVVLESCGPLLRSFARMVYSMRDIVAEKRAAANRPEQEQESPTDLASLQHDYFAIVDEFVAEVLGKHAKSLSSAAECIEHVRANARKHARSFQCAHPKLIERLDDYYEAHPTGAYPAIRSLGGAKLVLSGQRFNEATSDAVRSMSLYADTILIPDPILPWLEAPRPDEQFPAVELLRTAFTLSRFRPLVDVDLPYPAIAVFPSWEKRLERHDEVTQDNIARLVLDFFSYYMDARFEDESELQAFAAERQALFLERVDQARLFVPPGGRGTEDVSNAIRIYRESCKTWRSESFNKTLEGVGDGSLVLAAIWERLVPVYHSLENSQELLGEPMFWLDSHWHYYRLCSDMMGGQLVAESHVSSDTIKVVRAVGHPSLQWLGNVPMSALVQLRRANENESFRRSLAEHTARLRDASLDDIDRIAGEVSRGIASLLAIHQTEVTQIQAEYETMHGKTAVAAWVTLAATFFPALAPFHPPAAVGPLIGKYLWDKVGERAKRNTACRSLAGVLAAARAKK